MDITLHVEFSDDHLLDLFAMEQRIMARISEFSQRQADFNRQLEQAVDASAASVTALVADVAALNAKIVELQNSAGEITPEDQVLLDALEAQSAALSAKAAAVSQALSELDAMTPPTPAP